MWELLRASEWVVERVTTRKGRIIKLRVCWCCGADQPNHDPNCALRRALEEA